MKAKQIFGLMMFAVIFLAACQVVPTPVPIQPVNLEDTPLPARTQPVAIITPSKEATVESIEIVFLESFPLQVFAVLKGYLPDGCTVIDDTETEFVENSFLIRITTQRLDDAVCTLALVPFEETVSLDAYGLPAGTYRVAVDETKAEFTFTQDNIQSVGG